VKDVDDKIDFINATLMEPKIWMKENSTSV
jgi:hypothetical protein